MSCANSSAHQSVNQYVKANCAYADLVHPILGVKAKDGLNGRVLDKQIFIELLVFDPPNGNVIWWRDFFKAESEAAIQCCAAVKGMQRDKLSYLLGQPYRIANHENFSQMPINEETWMYEFGGNKIPIELSLKNSCCTLARIHDWRVYAEQNHIPRVFWESPVQYHPILKIGPNQEMPNQGIEPSVFRKLKNSTVIGSHSDWERSYRKVEKQAARRFCELVLGMSEKEITNLVGQPGFKGENIPCWKCSQPGESIWLYAFGGSDVNVRLVMRQNKCRLAEMYGWEDEISYTAWRQEELKKFAIGKTMEEIIAKEGPPFVYEDASSDAPELRPSQHFDAQSPIVYFVSPSIETTLYFQNGRCVSAANGGIAH